MRDELSLFKLFLFFAEDIVFDSNFTINLSLTLF
jgi:hypothetical protein